MTGGGYDIGLSIATSSGASNSGPVNITSGGKLSPIAWVVIGAIALLVVVAWLKGGRR
jgi:hypothetical protein